MNKQKRIRDYYSLLSFGSYLGRYKLRLSIVFVAFLIANISLTIVPVFVGKLVGSLTGAHINAHQAYLYVWVLIGLSTAHNLLWRVGEYFYLKLLNRISFSYETIVFTQIARKPYPYFVDKFTGKISSYVNTLGQEYRDLMEKMFWDYTNQVISLVAVCIILTAVNWQTGLIFTSGIAVMFVVGRLTIRNSTKYEKVWADIQSTKNGKIIDAIANFVNIKSFQKEELEIATVTDEMDKTIKAGNTSFVWNMVFWASMSLIVRDMIWPITIAFNVYLFIHHRISLSDLTIFLTAVVLFSTYIWDIIWDISQFNLKLARIDEAHSYLFGNVNIVKEYYATNQEVVPIRNFKQSLALKDLNFSYPDKPDDPILKSINLSIEKGEKLGIVGKSGSGKTTLTKLLLGYYPAHDSEISLDNESISTKQLARLISYVPQDTSLFHRSIADNIAYATERNVDHKDIIQAAKQAHAHEFIVKISEGYEALVGERGVKLSAGQRQRIAIARAFLDDKPLLILDEATSALDSESELLVQEALEALWQEKTVIAIAHRLSTLRHMDRIIVIDNGTIVEEGNHQALIAKKGHYAKLWSHQSGGFLHEDHED